MQGVSGFPKDVDGSAKCVEKWVAAIEKGTFTNVEECFEKREFWLFAAVCVEKSGVLLVGHKPKERLHKLGLKVLEMLKGEQQQISKALKAAEGVSKKMNSFPSQKRSKTIKKAIERGKLCFDRAQEKLKEHRVQIETIENCPNIECGRVYVWGLWRVFNGSKLAADVLQFPKAYDVELEIWTYWSCYDACVTRLSKYGVKVDKTMNASRSITECISAFTSLQTWSQSHAATSSEENPRNAKPVDSKPSSLKEECATVQYLSNGSGSTHVLGTNHSAKRAVTCDKRPLATPDANTFPSESAMGKGIHCATEEAAADASLGHPSEADKLLHQLNHTNKKQLLKERENFKRQLEKKDRQLEKLKEELKQTKEDLRRSNEKPKPSQERKCTTEAAFQTTKKTKMQGYYGAPPSPLRFQSDSTGSRHHTAVQCSLLNGNEAKDVTKVDVFVQCVLADANNTATDREAAASDCSQVHVEGFSDQQHKMNLFKSKKAASNDVGKRDLANGTPRPLSGVQYDVEEISNPRRPSEMAKRFKDLFNYTYDLYEIIKNERKCSEFTLEILMTAHRAAVLTLTEVGSKIVQAVGLGGDVDNPSAKNTIQECSVSLCKLSNRLQRQSCKSIRETAESFQKWRKKSIQAALLEHANEFLEKCIPVCWDLALQKRALLVVADHKVFDSSKHELFFGSEKTSKDIDHFVWPCLVEEITNRALVKGKVITKTAETTEKKTMP